MAITATELLAGFNDNGIDTVTKLNLYLQPGILLAQIGNLDGQIAAKQDEIESTRSTLQGELEALEAQRQALYDQLKP